MRVRYEEIATGPGPRERIVAVKMRDGFKEEIIVDDRILVDGAFEVGEPLAKDMDAVLVELPRESVRGYFRVWLPNSEVIDKELA